MTKGIVYYTDGLLDPAIARPVRAQLRRMPADQLIHVSIGGQVAEDGHWLYMPLERGVLTMFKQILAGLSKLTTDLAYLCEHDVLYHESHFNGPDELTYNRNVWKVDSSTGHAIHYPCSQTSGLSADRQLLIDHYTKRVELVERTGFSRAMGFEPGTHHRPERVDDLVAGTWMSDVSNIDIRHTTNLTQTKRSKSDFRNPRYAEGWVESDSVPGWGLIEGRFDNFLRDLQ